MILYVCFGYHRDGWVQALTTATSDTYDVAPDWPEEDLERWPMEDYAAYRVFKLTLPEGTEQQIEDAIMGAFEIDAISVEPVESEG